MSLDLLPNLRSSVVGVPEITEELGDWKGEPAVFTRRPVPDDAPMPMIIINPPSSIGDQDGLNSDRPVVTYDLAVYGNKGAPGAPEDQTRAVERAAYALRTVFHRNRFSVQPSGFYVIDVVARGPVPAPTDDEQTVGRVVSLTIRLRRA